MRHKKTHDKFAKMAARISMAEPPCMSNAEDWESQNGWVDEMGPLPEPDIGPPILPDGTTSEHRPVRWLIWACFCVHDKETSTTIRAEEITLALLTFAGSCI